MLVTTYSYKRIVLNSNPHTLVIIILIHIKYHIATIVLQPMF